MKYPHSSDYVIVGSGFGGAFLAYHLAKKGKEVLVLERGVWPVRDESSWDENLLLLPTPMYRGHTPILADQNGGAVQELWPEDTVGGLSTMYGCVALRMRAEDFLGAPKEHGSHRDPSTSWPVTYQEYEPYYAEAERLQHVAGISGEDITEPPRSSGFPQKPPSLPLPSRRIWDAAEALGLHPSHLPLAINFDGRRKTGKCIRCSTCERFLCRIQAKSDLSTVVLPEAMSFGARVLADTRVLGVNTTGSRANSVDVIHQSSGRRWTITTNHVVLSAGALGSPYLLLSSGIKGAGGGGDLIGRYLTRHSNCVSTALRATRDNPENEFQKHVLIPDYYHGGPNGNSGPEGPWGIIQQVQIPNGGFIRAEAPKGLKSIAATAQPHLSALLCIAEDIPQASNRVYVDPRRTDRFGQASLMVHHRYLPRDSQATQALARVARRILRRTGAIPVYTHTIETYSHAVGTCRFGKDRDSSVLDPECRVWGFENLYVVDGSFMPSGGSVNPSLTIGANALRVGAIMTGE